jgi:predicted transcriptional regulator
MSRPNNAHISKTFGKNLSEILNELGIKGCELSSMCNLTPACISQIINGKREPTLSTVVKIMKVIPVKFERLLK